jgi:hypothetical protein
VVIMLKNLRMEWCQTSSTPLHLQGHSKLMQGTPLRRMRVRMPFPPITWSRYLRGLLSTFQMPMEKKGSTCGCMGRCEHEISTGGMTFVVALGCGGECSHVCMARRHAWLMYTPGGPQSP